MAAATAEVWSCSSCTYLNNTKYSSCKMCEVQRPSKQNKIKMYSDVFDAEDGNDEEIRVMLLGRTGSGKSASGNTILRGEEFPSVMCGSGVTRECKTGTCQWRDKSIVVLDTPGLFDVDFTEEQFKAEIGKCVGLTAPGPHAFILVIRLGRFTEEEQATVEYFSKLFGDEFFKYMIILFTGKDELDRNNTSLSKFLQAAPTKLNEWLSKCDGRYVAFDNSASPREKSDMVDELLEMVTEMGRGKSQAFYTDEMYNSAETIIVKETEEMLKIRKTEYERQQEELRQLEQENDKTSRYVNKGANQLWKEEEQMQVLEARLESLRMCPGEDRESTSEKKRLKKEIGEIKEKHRRKKGDMEKRMEGFKGKMDFQRKKEKALQADVTSLRRQLRSKARSNLQAGKGKSAKDIIQVVGEKAWDVVQAVTPVIYPFVSDVVKKTLGLDISKIVPGVLGTVKSLTKK